MKLYKLIIIIAFLIIGCETQNNVGKEVVIQWSPSPSTDVAYYKVYFLIEEDTVYVGFIEGDTLCVVIPGISAVDSTGNESIIVFPRWTMGVTNTKGGVN